MPFNVDNFATHLRQNAEGNSQSRCAKFVRRALEAGGADTTGHLVDAKTYGPILLRNGFHAIAVEDPATFMPQKGDVVVIEPTQHGNQAGHIAGYDGRNWVSDYVQHGFWPNANYSRETPSYVVYRP